MILLLFQIQIGGTTMLLLLAACIVRTGIERHLGTAVRQHMLEGQGLRHAALMGRSWRWCRKPSCSSGRSQAQNIKSQFGVQLHSISQ